MYSNSNNNKEHKYESNIPSSYQGPPLKSFSSLAPSSTSSSSYGQDRNGQPMIDTDGLRLPQVTSQHANHYASNGTIRGGFTAPTSTASPPKPTFANETDRQVYLNQCRVFVQGLPPNVTWQHLKDHFRYAARGEKIHVLIKQDRMTKQSKGCGSVEFGSPELAQAAIAGMNGTELAGYPGYRIQLSAFRDQKVEGLADQAQRALAQLEQQQQQAAAIATSVGGGSSSYSSILVSDENPFAKKLSSTTEPPQQAAQEFNFASAAGAQNEGKELPPLVAQFLGFENNDSNAKPNLSSSPPAAAAATATVKQEEDVIQKGRGRGKVSNLPSWMTKKNKTNDDNGPSGDNIVNKKPPSNTEQQLPDKAGRGRGRGKHSNLPSWMTRQQQQEGPSAAAPPPRDVSNRNTNNADDSSPPRTTADQKEESSTSNVQSKISPSKMERGRGRGRVSNLPSWMTKTKVDGPLSAADSSKAKQSSPPSSNPTSDGPGKLQGRGRGRGAVSNLPSWMTSKQRQEDGPTAAARSVESSSGNSYPKGQGRESASNQPSWMMKTGKGQQPQSNDAHTSAVSKPTHENNSTSTTSPADVKPSALSSKDQLIAAARRRLTLQTSNPESNSDKVVTKSETNDDGEDSDYDGLFDEEEEEGGDPTVSSPLRKGAITSKSSEDLAKSLSSAVVENPVDEATKSKVMKWTTAPQKKNKSSPPNKVKSPPKENSAINNSTTSQAEKVAKLQKFKEKMKLQKSNASKPQSLKDSSPTKAATKKLGAPPSTASTDRDDSDKVLTAGERVKLKKRKASEEASTTKQSKSAKTETDDSKSSGSVMQTMPLSTGELVKLKKRSASLKQEPAVDPPQVATKKKQAPKRPAESKPPSQPKKKKVAKQERTLLHIKYDDGDVEWLDPSKEKMRPLGGGSTLDLAVGKRVEVYWDDDDAYYPGTIAEHKVETIQSESQQDEEELDTPDRSSKEDCEWVQCDTCNTWRKLPSHIKASSLPDV